MPAAGALADLGSSRGKSAGRFRCSARRKDAAPRTPWYKRLMKTLAGTYSADGLAFGIVASRFNETITRRLLSGAVDGLERHGASGENITVAWVPGAMEVPLVAKKLATGGQYDAVITLGAVIRGATSHYEHVCTVASSGVARVSLETGVPIIFGILTTDTIEQAVERAGTKSGNTGFSAAMSAIEMANLVKDLDDAS